MLLETLTIWSYLPIVCVFEFNAICCLKILFKHYGLYIAWYTIIPVTY